MRQIAGVAHGDEDLGREGLDPDDALGLGDGEPVVPVERLNVAVRQEIVQKEGVGSLQTAADQALVVAPHPLLAGGFDGSPVGRAVVEAGQLGGSPQRRQGVDCVLQRRALGLGGD